jgi:prephenate dehydrogenase
MPRNPARRVGASRPVEHPAVGERVLERIMVATPMDEAQGVIVELAPAESRPVSETVSVRG